MQIAVIAWGSLLWKPGPLKLASGWHPGGPLLPLEFVRNSEDTPELALALCEGARMCPTYWAYLDAPDVPLARAMLREREKIDPAHPEWVGTVPASAEVNTPMAGRIEAWRRDKAIDAVVWTAVPARFAGSEGRVPSAQEVLHWLATRTGDERAAAEHYIRRTPAHIDTRYRRLIEAVLGWRPLREAYVTCTV
jgi:hypothetical protein